jgi:hypothetical protein
VVYRADIRNMKMVFIELNDQPDGLYIAEMKGRTGITSMKFSILK